MKIVSWNCNRKFREKFVKIQSLDADIFVVQECENPAETTNKNYRSWASNYLWNGTNEHQGIGIFARPEIELSLLNWDPDDLELFLPCRVNNSFNLVGVWTKANTRKYQYIGQFWKYLQKHKLSIANSETICVGDFNSNVYWDKPSRNWNHSDVVRELLEIGLESLYHIATGEEQGTETQPTFYLQKNIEKPYHIDYFFASSHFHSNEFNLEILDRDVWLENSDHIPIIYTSN